MDYATDFTVTEEWFSGVRNRNIPESGYQSKPIGVVTAPATLTSVELVGQATDQDWGNFCALIGARVYRGGELVYNGYTRLNVHGWHDIDALVTPPEPVALLPGDEVDAYIQGPGGGGCSCRTKNFTWSINMTSFSPSSPL
jgi:hypothetical protein